MQMMITAAPKTNQNSFAGEKGKDLTLMFKQTTEGVNITQGIIAICGKMEYVENLLQKTEILQFFDAVTEYSINAEHRLP